MAEKGSGGAGRKDGQEERRLAEAVRTAIAQDPGMGGYEVNVKARGGEVVRSGQPGRRWPRPGA